MTETVALCNQRIRFQCDQVYVRVHCPCDLLNIIPVFDIFQYFIVRQGDLGSKGVCLVFHSALPHIENVKFLEAASLDRFFEHMRERYNEMIPSYTIFHKDTETFSNIWTEYKSNMEDFCIAYENDMRQFGNQNGMVGKPNAPKNIFTVSMIPWSTFEGFNLNLQKGYDYMLPIFTMGRFYQDSEKIMLPFAIQVHHAICDGFHICRFINELQELISG